ncbi:MAG: aspartate-semialdehyde dehydrogenase [Candidatus Nezhaarchaeota archaeon]|nr:aspartate-semialdehyde dehydrogenase [Candidatus Nezhaarchaeota archaeon]
MDKLKVAVLGATGMVGQRFIKMLAKHELFELAAITASPSSAGRRYIEAVHWYIEGEVPKEASEMTVIETSVEAVKKAGRVDVAFSALPAEVALEVEAEFAKAGIPIVSDASSYRMEPDVPILIGEVNPDHLGLVKYQAKRGWRSFIVTNPNCTATILIMALKPLLDSFGVRRVFASTMQAVSGAGWGGVPSMAIIDNLIPYIANEEEKVEAETLKIMGALREGGIEPAKFKISASCHRVGVLDGHVEAVFVELEKAASIEEVKESMERFKGLPQELKLPTAPQRPIVVREEPDRPQPRFDRMEGGGMSIVVGRIRRDPALRSGVKFIVLGHNTIRGAAGNALLNAELMTREGYL